jgi:D-glycero-D-manno-heptose 1,7-bisphosphate phosphatase
MKPIAENSRLITRRFEGIKFVLLDRDGVTNRKLPEGQFIAHWRDFEFLPGVESAIVTLSRSGRRLIIITNQRGIALGLYTRTDLENLHLKLQEHVAKLGARIDAFYYCPHDRDECDCRKPNTGLFRQMFQDFPEASRQNTIIIGDSLSDIQAARALGLSAIFIQGDPKTQKPGAGEAAALADAVAGSLIEAVEKYL